MGFYEFLIGTSKHLQEQVVLNRDLWVFNLGFYAFTSFASNFRLYFFMLSNIAKCQTWLMLHWVEFTFQVGFCWINRCFWINWCYQTWLIFEFWKLIDVRWLKCWVVLHTCLVFIVVRGYWDIFKRKFRSNEQKSSSLFLNNAKKKNSDESSSIEQESCWICLVLSMRMLCLIINLTYIIDLQFVSIFERNWQSFGKVGWI